MDSNEQLSIGEAARRIGVAAHTIRYWEKEFSEFLHPRRSRGSQRKYGTYEIELLLRIKGLLRDEGYSIAGARRRMQNALVGKEPVTRDLLLNIARLIDSGRDAATAPAPAVAAAAGAHDVSRPMAV